MVQKIKTSSNEYWLIEQKDIFQNILIGDAVRLTRQKSDDYFFIHDVQLIKSNKIKSYDDILDNEILFFDYVKRMKEVPVRNFITEDFDVKKYLVD